MVRLAVARVLHGTIAEGPNRRTAIWVQGCSLQCPGCINPHLFEFVAPTTDVAELAIAIAGANVEGITLLGGEPFDQADACAELAERVRDVGIGVITFSGYRYEELAAGRSGHQRLLDATDLLVDGRYVATLGERDRGLVGSTNQQFVHLTDRYRAFDPHAHPNRVDIRISADGSARVAGFLRTGQLRILDGGSSPERRRRMRRS